jgi:hypothetical protein
MYRNTKKSIYSVNKIKKNNTIYYGRLINRLINWRCIIMFEMCNSCSCEDFTNTDYDNIEHKINSKCCNGFVKEKFTLKTTAKQDVKVVYTANPGTNFVRGTVILKNLSSATINFVVDGANVVVEANDEAAITVNNLNVVSVQIISAHQSARVLLFFDIQVNTFAEACCPSLDLSEI